MECMSDKYTFYLTILTYYIVALFIMASFKQVQRVHTVLLIIIYVCIYHSKRMTSLIYFNK